MDMYYTLDQVDLSNQSEFDVFASMQRIPRQDAYLLNSFMRASFGADGLLEKVDLVLEGEPETGAFREWLNCDDAIGILKQPDAATSPIYALQKHMLGRHLVGGAPTSFTIPSSPLRFGLQYIGSISMKDPLFSWIGFDFNLVAPLTVQYFEKCWIDYSNPAAPVFCDFNTDFDEFGDFDDVDPQGFFVTYKSMRWSATPLSRSNEKYLGTSGAPLWVQAPDFPIHPDTGKPLKFVLQIESMTTTLAESSIGSDDYVFSHLEFLAFWGDGTLYVFLDPETRLACYLIQNT